jgi:zinc protease
MASRRRPRATTPTRRKVKRAPAPSRRRVTTRRWQPEPGLPQLDIRSLPGPETIRRQELPNGMVALARENFSSPSVVVSGYLAAGSIDESPRQAGLADLTAAALTRGTERWSFRELYEKIESVGASFGVGSGKHTTSFHGKSLAEDLGLLLEVLAESLIHPVFPEAQVSRLKGEKLTALAIRDQDTGARASMAFDELVYPDHPYSLPDDGYPDTVSLLTPADLAAFRQRSYGPRGMTVAVVGAVKAKAAIEAVAAHFSGWQNAERLPQPELPALRPAGKQRRKDVPLPGKSQCDLVMGGSGPGRLDPAYHAAALGNSILGRFGLYGRIGDAVRESAGLAYYAYSSIGGGPGPDPWQVAAGVNPANVDRAIDLIRAEIRRFVTRRVTPGELLENQAHFIGRLPLQLESNEGVAGALVHVERFHLGLDYHQRYPDLVRSVTRDQILETARRFLDPERIAIAVAGPRG